MISGNTGAFYKYVNKKVNCSNWTARLCENYKTTVNPALWIKWTVIHCQSLRPYLCHRLEGKSSQRSTSDKPICSVQSMKRPESSLRGIRTRVCIRWIVRHLVSHQLHLCGSRRWSNFCKEYHFVTAYWMTYWWQGEMTMNIFFLDAHLDKLNDNMGGYSGLCTLLPRIYKTIRPGVIGKTCSCATASIVVSLLINWF